MRSAVGSAGTQRGNGRLEDSVPKELKAVMIYIPPELAEELVSAVAWIQDNADLGYSKNAFSADAISRELARLRRRHKDSLGGGDFPKAANLRVGRPPTKKD